MKVSLLLVLSLLLPLLLQGQDWELTKQRSFDSQITSCAKNNQGDIYLGFENGSIIILDKKGEELLYNADMNNSEVSSIDATNRLRPLIFRREQQILNFIDRFNNRTTGIELSEISQQFVWLCRQGTQNDVWLFTSDFLEIIKYDLTTGIKTSTPLITKNGLKIERPIQMHIYRNVLILLDEGLGLILFDQFGNYLNQIPKSQSKAMDIHNQEIVIRQEENFIFTSPYEQLLSKTKKAPNGAFDKFLWLDSVTLATISKNQISIYLAR